MREKRSLGAGRSRWNDQRWKNGDSRWYANTKGVSRKDGGRAKGGVGGWSFSEATSLFISNLPNNCEESMMWPIMKESGTVVDIFIIKNRLYKHGCRFGFARFNRVQHVPTLEAELNTKKIEGRSIFGRVAKFARPAKTPKGSHHRTVLDKDEKKGIESKGIDHVSYAEAVKPGGKHLSYTETISNTNSEAGEEHRQLKTKMVEIKLNENPNRNSPQVRMVGKWILINLPTSDEKEKLMNNQELRSWFNILKQWDNKFIVEDRIFWVKIEGIPLQIWNPETFITIGREWGEVLITDPCSQGGKVVHARKICILTKKMDIIRETITLKFAGNSTKIRIKELDEAFVNWNPMDQMENSETEEGEILDSEEEEEEDLCDAGDSSSEIHSNEEAEKPQNHPQHINHYAINAEDTPDRTTCATFEESIINGEINSTGDDTIVGDSIKTNQFNQQETQRPNFPIPTNNISSPNTVQ
ncbi:hypothetical protein LXL04_004437 [Taraxacum kok-saghyz]